MVTRKKATNNTGGHADVSLDYTSIPLHIAPVLHYTLKQSLLVHCRREVCRNPLTATVLTQGKK